MRLSVSDLESYRYWKADEESTLDDLLKRLRHDEPPTPAMEAGRAMAKLFERAQAGDLYSAAVDGWDFTFDIDGEFSLPQAHELKAEELIVTPSGPVTFVGKADGLDGLVVHDQKLTERIDCERYVDSLQWRAYLMLFGASSFVYDLFACRYRGKSVTIYDYQRLAFYTYPTIREDVTKAVCELAAVVKQHMPEAA